jgi:hypothetical protein
MKSCDKCANWDRMWVCIEGTVYGPCSYPECGGVCEATEECECDCHESLASTN